MSTHFNADQNLKKLKNAILNTPIEVDMKDKIMMNLDNNQKELYVNPIKAKKSWKSKTLVALASSAAAVSLLIGTSMASPALASTLSQIPLVSNLFHLAGDMGLKVASQEGFYTVVNTSDTHKELTVKASAVSYDGTRVFVAIEGTESGAYKDWTTKVQNIDIAINDKDIKAYSIAEDNNAGIFFFPTANKDSMILEFGDLKNQGGISFPDHFNASLSLNIQGIEEPFKLNVPVQLNTDNVLVMTPAIQKSAKDVSFKVNELQLTPITTTLTTEFSTLSKINDSDKKYGYELQDDKGNKIEMIYAHGWNADDGNILTTDTQFEPFISLPKFIIIKPFTYVFEENSNKYKMDKNGNIKVNYIPELEIKLPIEQDK